MKRFLKRLPILIVIVLAVLCIGFVSWTRLARYSAFPDAAALGARAARAPQGWLVFNPGTPNGSGLVFYPGGLVDAAAYAPLAQALADRGTLVVIPPMPLELAVFGVGSADAVIAAYPGVERWAIGGHSLGGSMAGAYVGNHAADIAAGRSRIKGVLLCGSYIQESAGVNALPIAGLSVYGSNDTLAKPPITREQRLAGAPKGTRLVEVPGGNHAMFGDYGPQAGDGTATAPLATLRQQIVDETAAFLASMR